MFEPMFIPVMQHIFQEPGMNIVRTVLRQCSISTAPEATYGGLVFTSQRAVEAFAKTVEEAENYDKIWTSFQDVPVYSVGPATTRALKAIPCRSSLQIFGGHTGNGYALAKFILDHYGQWYEDRPLKPALLFLVGEQRRDVIPRTLTAVGLASDRKIPVDEVIVYGTNVMQSFPQDFESALQATENRPARWVVVFSPTGCDGMLRGLSILNEYTGKAEMQVPLKRKIFIATIGPTTRDFLERTFAFKADVCADEPTPEGLMNAIADFMRNMPGM
ncbi:Uroporphyrinogen-III synthase [Colletotrichum orbiculare MAFF 240422]|uniref:Uroporphyrinogen-III synthase n=1 Tax=Colletotrichum orbiculare (strain 104-T / ATCC 96160 / CBS 514.97 / LARS 414 / MAFF 240422) TaxID=1213857 RepID=A0A484FKM4_COLOR|nr:Uroporphyrinogen-III synthase [Colletotrichum orbiculare MAFF 240422]